MFWFILIGTALLAWLWWDGLGAKEVARKAGIALCARHEVQFLDDTVMLARLRLRRDQGGNPRLYRQFGFEFSTDGDSRYQGYIDMLGQQVVATHMQPYRI